MIPWKINLCWLLAGIRIKRFFPLISPFTYYFQIRVKVILKILKKFVVLCNRKKWCVISKYIMYSFYSFSYFIYIGQEQMSAAIIQSLEEYLPRRLPWRIFLHWEQIFAVLNLSRPALDSRVLKYHMVVT